MNKENQIFVIDLPPEAVKKLNDPRPIVDFLPEDEKAEWLEYVKYLEEWQKNKNIKS